MGPKYILYSSMDPLGFTGKGRAENSASDLFGSVQCSAFEFSVLRQMPGFSRQTCLEAYSTKDVSSGSYPKGPSTQ